MSRVRARGIALEQLTAARAALGSAVADLLRNRSVKCAPRCPGWRVQVDADSASDAPVLLLCEECARLAGYAGAVEDADLRALPAARRALARALAPSLRTYAITTAMGDRRWHAEDEEHAREQHLDAFPDERVIAVRLVS